MAPALTDLHVDMSALTRRYAALLPGAAVGLTATVSLSSEEASQSDSSEEAPRRRTRATSAPARRAQLRQEPTTRKGRSESPDQDRLIVAPCPASPDFYMTPSNSGHSPTHFGVYQPHPVTPRHLHDTQQSWPEALQFPRCSDRPSLFSTSSVQNVAWQMNAEQARSRLLRLS